MVAAVDMDAVPGLGSTRWVRRGGDVAQEIDGHAQRCLGARQVIKGAWYARRVGDAVFRAVRLPRRRAAGGVDGSQHTPALVDSHTQRDGRARKAGKRTESTFATLQVPLPPIGSVELSTSPVMSPTTHIESLGHDPVTVEVVLLICASFQALGPPVGWFE